MEFNLYCWNDNRWVFLGGWLLSNPEPINIAEQAITDLKGLAISVVTDLIPLELCHPYRNRNNGRRRRCCRFWRKIGRRLYFWPGQQRTCEPVTGFIGSRYWFPGGGLPV